MSRSRKEVRSSKQLAAAATFALVWGLALFGALDTDVWSAKMLILGSLAPISFGLEKLFYGL